jgi:hypothetical protein
MSCFPKEESVRYASSHKNGLGVEFASSTGNQLICSWNAKSSHELFPIRNESMTVIARRENVPRAPTRVPYASSNATLWIPTSIWWAQRCMAIAYAVDRLAMFCGLIPRIRPVPEAYAPGFSVALPFRLVDLVLFGVSHASQLSRSRSP